MTDPENDADVQELRARLFGKRPEPQERELDPERAEALAMARALFQTPTTEEYDR